MHNGESVFDKEGLVCIHRDLFAIQGSLTFVGFHTDTTEELVEYRCINWIQNTMKIPKQNQTQYAMSSGNSL